MSSRRLFLVFRLETTELILHCIIIVDTQTGLSRSLQKDIYISKHKANERPFTSPWQKLGGSRTTCHRIQVIFGLAHWNGQTILYVYLKYKQYFIFGQLVRAAIVTITFILYLMKTNFGYLIATCGWKTKCQNNTVDVVKFF